MIEDKSKCNQSHLWRMESVVEDVKDELKRSDPSHLWGMESVVEDVEDQRQTEGSPANSQSYKKLVGWDDMRHSWGVNQTKRFPILNQLDDDIES